VSLGPLFVTKNLARNGSSWALESLLKQLPCPARICTLSGPRRLELSGITILGSDKSKSSWLRHIRPLLQEIKKENSPVIAWGREAIKLLGWMKRFGLVRSKKTLIGYWDTLPDDTWLERMASCKFHCVFASVYETCGMLSMDGLTPVSYFPHPKPNLSFNPPPKLESGLRCGWIGELDTPHSAREANWIFGVYSYTNADSTLTILGEGDYLEAHRTFDDNILGKENTQVRFETPSASLMTDLARFNVLFVPLSNDDPIPLILKAMSLGLVVFAARTPIIERVITHRENGILYIGGDIHQAGKLLVELDQNRNLLQELGKAAKTSIEQRPDEGLGDWRELLGIPQEVVGA